MPREYTQKSDRSLSRSKIAKRNRKKTPWGKWGDSLISKELKKGNKKNDIQDK